MPSTGGRKFGRKGAMGPDTIDLAEVFKSFYEEFGLTPWLNITIALDGGMMVEGVVEAKNADGITKTYHAVRVFNPNVENVLHILLQVAHQLWHQVDRNAQR